MKITVASQIKAPPDVAFATVCDIERWPNFIAGIERVEMITPGPVAQGTRFRETRIMFGRKAAEDMTIEAFDPPARLLLSAHNHGTDYRVDHVFTARDEGTLLELSFSGNPTTVAARLLAPLGRLMAGNLRAKIAADLDDLRREAERRVRS